MDGGSGRRERQAEKNKITLTQTRWKIEACYHWPPRKGVEHTGHKLDEIRKKKKKKERNRLSNK